MKKILNEVTVVVVTYNEEKNISDCLQSIKRNKPSKIILVDASSKDNTVKIAKSLGVQCHVVPKTTLTHDRQYGVDLVKTKYVCLVDADNRLDKECVSSLLIYLKSSNFVGVAAQKLRMKEMKDYWSKCWEWHNKTRLYTLGEKMVIGTPALYVTKVLQEIKYNVKNVSADDNDFCYRLSRLGYKVGVGPGFCREKMVASFKEFKKKLLGYGKGDAEFFLKHPERRLRMGTHMLRNYFIRGIFYSIKHLRFDLIPFYVIYSFIRYYGFLKVLIQITLLHQKSNIHPGYISK